MRKLYWYGKPPECSVFGQHEWVFADLQKDAEPGEDDVVVVWFAHGPEAPNTNALLDICARHHTHLYVGTSSGVMFDHLLRKRVTQRIFLTAKMLLEEVVRVGRGADKRG